MPALVEMTRWVRRREEDAEYAEDGTRRHHGAGAAEVDDATDADPGECGYEQAAEIAAVVVPASQPVSAVIRRSVPEGLADDAPAGDLGPARDGWSRVAAAARRSPLCGSRYLFLCGELDDLRLRRRTAAVARGLVDFGGIEDS